MRGALKDLQLKLLRNKLQDTLQAGLLEYRVDTCYYPIGVRPPCLPRWRTSFFQE